MKEIILKGIDEKIYYDECDNGLPIYMWVNEKVNNFYITLSVKYGSVDTEFKVDGEDDYTKVHDGIAHFLEHVNFNEGKNKTAHDYFNKLGSSINAFTTFNFTCYEVFACNDFAKNLNHLLDYVQTPYFTTDLTNKEKGIICEEVKMGKNSPGHKLYYGMNNALYKNDKRKILVTGEVEDVKATTVDELELVYNTFYRPSNMFVVITGNFNPYEAVGIIKDNQKKKDFGEDIQVIKKEVSEPREVNSEYEEIECNVEIPKVKVCYKMLKKDFGKIEPRLLNIYLSVILRNNFGTTSLLREDLLEKELVTAISASREMFGEVVTIVVNAETKYPDEVIKIIKDKMNNLTISEKEIKRRVKANIAALINDYDDIEYINSDIADQIVTFGDIATDMYDMYNKLNVKEANDIIKKLNLTNNSTVVLVPMEKSENKKTQE